LEAIAAPWLAKSTKRIRLILGPQDDFFESSSMETLFREPYSVSPRFNRVGYWLDGPLFKHSSKGYNIVSDGIAFGSIQVPGSGQAVVLLADRQPTGGYPKIATVIRADVGHLAQTRPGQELRFERCDFDQARDALLELDQNLGRIAEYILPAGSTDSEYLLGCNLIDGVVSVGDG
jgi:allophanate hydrolase subunit 2